MLKMPVLHMQRFLQVNLKIEMTKILEMEGFIHGFRLIKNDKQGLIKIALKYDKVARLHYVV